MKHLKQVRKIKPLKGRPSDRQIYHALEHFDNAFTELALGVGLIVEHYKNQTKTRRKSDG